MKTRIRSFLGNTLVVVAVLIGLAMLFFPIFGFGVLVPKRRAIDVLTAEGYTEVVVTSKHFLAPHWLGGCGKDDAVGFDVTATNPVGKRVEVSVCCGSVIKGCTIRR